MYTNESRLNGRMPMFIKTDRFAIALVAFGIIANQCRATVVNRFNLRVSEWNGARNNQSIPALLYERMVPMLALSRFGVGALLALILGVAPASAGLVYTDTTFNLADYSASSAFSS